MRLAKRIRRHTKEDGEFVPFGNILDYKSLHQKSVLEIGCGMGTMAMNWAKRDHVRALLYIKKSIAMRFGWSLWIEAEKP